MVKHCSHEGQGILLAVVELYSYSGEGPSRVPPSDLKKGTVGRSVS